MEGTSNGQTLASSYIPPSAGSSHSFETAYTRDSTLAQPPSTPSRQQDFVNFKVICLYDFTSNDPAHISFKKGDMLTVLKIEQSGWWGAQKKGRGGWIPASYVSPLSAELAQTLGDVPDEKLRFYEFEAEKTYRDAPVKDLADPYAPQRYLNAAPHERQAPIRPASIVTDIPDSRSIPPYDTPPTSPLTVNESDGHAHESHISDEDYPPDSDDIESEISPGTDVSPIASTRGPTVPSIITSGNDPGALTLNKPTPPTPTFTETDGGAGRAVEVHPLVVRDNIHAIHSTDLYTESEDDNVQGFSDPSSSSSPWSVRRRAGRRGESKVRQVLGDGDAQAYYNAKVAQAALPWYLQPLHVGEEIRLDRDDSIGAGTIEALIERLTIDPLRLSQEKKFRSTFLTTFKSFTSADKLFESLTTQYYMEPPPGLNQKEEREWVDKKHRPTQRRILNVLSEWLEHHGMVEDDPHLIPKLQLFLFQINSDSPTLALTAKHIHQSSVERSMRPNPMTGNPSQKPSKSQKWKMGGALGEYVTSSVKTDILQVDPSDLAQQLTLYDARLFAKIRPQECLVWPKVQKGDIVQNLSAFCASSDKLACWVKYSILIKEGLGRRADTVDKWIRVAEKCRHLNNINSTCTIVAALSNSAIERLHLTWAHVERKTQLLPLQQLAMPKNNFRECRELQRSIVVPCVPFIGMSLTDLTHANDKLPDNISVNPSSDYPQGLTLINFSKRQSSADIIERMLRHQSKPYHFSEKPQMMNFIEQQLAISAKDGEWFWQKSQELQHAEVAHADIKRNLEAAGF